MLIQISLGYPSVKGRLHTRYAPVRHSSSEASFHVTVRLACVKPAASVHPEPGSNSSLLNLKYYLKQQSNLTYSKWFILLTLSISICIWTFFFLLQYLSVIAGAKIQLFFSNNQTLFYVLFKKIFKLLFISILTCIFYLFS